MNDKCRMQGILNHSLSGLKANPFLAQRIISQSDSRKPQKAKLSFIIICVITMLLIGTMTALAAGVENINAILYKIWPEAARTLRPLNLSDEKAGIRLDVLSASMCEDHLLIAYSLTDLTGDRINSNTECNIIINGLSGLDYNPDKIVSYDPITHQIIYAAYVGYSSLESQEGLSESALLNNVHTIEFTVTGIVNPLQTVIDLWPLMTDQEYKSESVPGPTNPSILGTIITDDSFNGTTIEIPHVLNPENNLGIPIIDGVELSGIGWIDGMMHVQLHIPHHSVSIETEHISSIYYQYLSYVILKDQQGNEITWGDSPYIQQLIENQYYVSEIGWIENDELWIEKVFPVRPEDMDHYVIYGEFEDRTNLWDFAGYEWQVSFPTNMIQVEVK